MNVIAFGYRKQNHLFIVAVIYENQNASQNDDNVNECCWTLSGCETNNIIVNVMHYTRGYSC